MNDFQREIAAMRSMLDTLEALSLPAAKRSLAYVIEHVNERIQTAQKADEAKKNTAVPVPAKQRRN